MGAAVANLLQNDAEARVCCGVDVTPCEDGKIPVYKTFDSVKEKADVILDFSSPAALNAELDWAVKNGVPVVLAATGYEDSQLKLIDARAEKVAENLFSLICFGI